MSATNPIEDDLDEFLADVEQPPDYHPPEVEGGATSPGPWKIEDDGAADWCLRKLARVMARQAAVRELMQERLRHLQEWEQARLKEPRAEEAHWRGLLDDYALRRREATKQPSVSLPNGVLSTRKSGEAVEVAFEWELLAWLDLIPGMRARWCKIEPEPQVSRFKDEVDIIDGASCESCGQPIIRAGPGMWTGPHGAVCTKSASHRPTVNDEGEVYVRRVATWRPPEDPKRPEAPRVAVVVPGLAVRAEVIHPTARPS